jgi:hypothetical protein
MKINNKIKDFARDIHKAEHLFVEHKIDKSHRLEDWYYLMASTIYHNLSDKIDLILEENKKLKKKITTNSVELRILTNKLRELINREELTQKIKEMK